MIFVTVGTQKFGFNRLLRAIDDLINAKIISGKEVYAQIGHSLYRPENYESVQFMNLKEYEVKQRESDIIICHAGTGIITQALRANKKLIVVPRQKRFKEHVDDHQLETSKFFASNGYTLECLEIEHLEKAILESAEFVPKEYQSNRDQLIDSINEIISLWLNK